MTGVIMFATLLGVLVACQLARLQKEAGEEEHGHEFKLRLTDVRVQSLRAESGPLMVNPISEMSHV